MSWKTVVLAAVVALAAAAYAGPAVNFCVLQEDSAVKQFKLSTLSRLFGELLTTESNGNIYIVSVCRPIPKTYYDPRQLAGAVKITSDGDAIDLGRIDQTDVVVNEDTIVLTYVGGDIDKSKGDTCKGLKWSTYLTFECDPSATTDVLTLIDEDPDQPEICQTWFEIKTQKTCIREPNIPLDVLDKYLSNETKQNYHNEDAEKRSSYFPFFHVNLHNVLNPQFKNHFKIRNNGEKKVDSNQYVNDEKSSEEKKNNFIRDRHSTIHEEKKIIPSENNPLVNKNLHYNKNEFINKGNTNDEHIKNIENYNFGKRVIVPSYNEHEEKFRNDISADKSFRYVREDSEKEKEIRVRENQNDNRIHSNGENEEIVRRTISEKKIIPSENNPLVNNNLHYNKNEFINKGNTNDEHIKNIENYNFGKRVIVPSYNEHEEKFRNDISADKSFRYVKEDSEKEKEIRVRENQNDNRIHSNGENEEIVRRTISEKKIIPSENNPLVNNNLHYNKNEFINNGNTNDDHIKNIENYNFGKRVIVPSYNEHEEKFRNDISADKSFRYVKEDSEKEKEIRVRENQNDYRIHSNGENEEIVRRTISEKKIIPSENNPLVNNNLHYNKNEFINNGNTNDDHIKNIENYNFGKKVIVPSYNEHEEKFRNDISADKSFRYVKEDSEKEKEIRVRENQNDYRIHSNEENEEIIRRTISENKSSKNENENSGNTNKPFNHENHNENNISPESENKENSRKTYPENESAKIVNINSDEEKEALNHKNHIHINYRIPSSRYHEENSQKNYPERESTKNVNTNSGKENENENSNKISPDGEHFQNNIIEHKSSRSSNEKRQTIYPENESTKNANINSGKESEPLNHENQNSNKISPENGHSQNNNVEPKSSKNENEKSQITYPENESPINVIINSGQKNQSPDHESQTSKKLPTENENKKTSKHSKQENESFINGHENSQNTNTESNKKSNENSGNTNEPLNHENKNSNKVPRENESKDNSQNSESENKVPSENENKDNSQNSESENKVPSENESKDNSQNSESENKASKDNKSKDNSQNSESENKVPIDNKSKNNSQNSESENKASTGNESKNNSQNSESENKASTDNESKNNSQNSESENKVPSKNESKNNSQNSESENKVPSENESKNNSQNSESKNKASKDNESKDNSQNSESENKVPSENESKNNSQNSESENKSSTNENETSGKTINSSTKKPSEENQLIDNSTENTNKSNGSSIIETNKTNKVIQPDKSETKSSNTPADSDKSTNSSDENNNNNNDSSKSTNTENQSEDSFSLSSLFSKIFPNGFQLSPTIILGGLSSLIVSFGVIGTCINRYYYKLSGTDQIPFKGTFQSIYRFIRVHIVNVLCCCGKDPEAPDVVNEKSPLLHPKSVATPTVEDETSKKHKSYGSKTDNDSGEQYNKNVFGSLSTEKSAVKKIKKKRSSKGSNKSSSDSGADEKLKFIKTEFDELRGSSIKDVITDKIKTIVNTKIKPKLESVFGKVVTDVKTLKTNVLDEENESAKTEPKSTFASIFGKAVERVVETNDEERDSSSTVVEKPTSTPPPPPASSVVEKHTSTPPPPPASNENESVVVVEVKTLVTTDEKKADAKREKETDVKTASETVVTASSVAEIETAKKEIRAEPIRDQIVTPPSTASRTYESKMKFLGLTDEQREEKIASSKVDDEKAAENEEDVEIIEEILYVDDEGEEGEEIVEEITETTTTVEDPDAADGSEAAGNAEESRTTVVTTVRKTSVVRKSSTASTPETTTVETTTTYTGNGGGGGGGGAGEKKPFGIGFGIDKTGVNVTVGEKKLGIGKSGVKFGKREGSPLEDKRSGPRPSKGEKAAAAAAGPPASPKSKASRSLSVPNFKMFKRSTSHHSTDSDIREDENEDDEPAVKKAQSKSSSGLLRFGKSRSKSTAALVSADAADVDVAALSGFIDNERRESVRQLSAEFDEITETAANIVASLSQDGAAVTVVSGSASPSPLPSPSPSPSAKGVKKSFSFKSAGSLLGAATDAVVTSATGSKDDAEVSKKSKSSSKTKRAGKNDKSRLF